MQCYPKCILESLNACLQWHQNHILVQTHENVWKTICVTYSIMLSKGNTQWQTEWLHLNQHHLLCQLKWRTEKKTSSTKMPHEGMFWMYTRLHTLLKYMSWYKALMLPSNHVRMIMFTMSHDNVLITSGGIWYFL